MTYPDLNQYAGLCQAQLDWLLKSGVTVEAMIAPTTILLATGYKAHAGRFEEDPAGEPWLAIPEPEDVVYWQPKAGELATWNGRAFALGEAVVDDPLTCAFDNHLNVFADPLEWLRAGRDGCVILDWHRAFDRLRDVSRIAVAESLLFQWRRAMKPPRTPETLVLTGRRAAA